MLAVTKDTFTRQDYTAAFEAICERSQLKAEPNDSACTAFVINALAERIQAVPELPDREPIFSSIQFALSFEPVHEDVFRRIFVLSHDPKQTMQLIGQVAIIRRKIIAKAGV